ncbi:MAG: N-6 DNA methylase [Gammaproteobacteria bacterium]
MEIMYRIDRNNFHRAPKTATIYTPPGVSRFIYGIVHDKIDRAKTVLDPCVGAGSLLAPFRENGFNVAGIDIEDQGFPGTAVRNYLEIQRGEIAPPALVVMNPPFNIDGKTKQYAKLHYGGRPLLPEVWLQKTAELFSKHVPIVLFAPYGLRLNQTAASRRWQKFAAGQYPEISSIVSLPKDVFSGILFHSEILMFNICGAKPHYFYGAS